MSNQVIFITLCLLALMGVACSSSSVHAPIDSRSHNVQPRSSPGVKASPLKTGRSYSTSRAGYYVVKRGDTLFSIANRYAMGYWQLASINGIRPPFTIYAGQRLRLRGEAKAGADAARTQKAVKQKPKPVTKAVTKAEVEPVTAKDSPVVEFDGKWQWPTRGRLLRTYKPNEPGKKGIYIGGHSGQPVKAAASGKVVYVGSGLVGYGRLIIIRHNENLLSTYGHNSELLVAEGEYVKAGHVIAKMGSSGTGRTELYFEIRKQGKPVNPLVYLPKQH